MKNEYLVRNYPNGSIYFGEMKDCKRHGKGTFIRYQRDRKNPSNINSVSYYQSNWKNGKKDGFEIVERYSIRRPINVSCKCGLCGRSGDGNGKNCIVWYYNWKNGKLFGCQTILSKKNGVCVDTTHRVV